MTAIQKKKKTIAPVIDTHGIQKKTDYEHIRLRTNMYLGSCDPHTQTVLNFVDGDLRLEEMTWVPALYTGTRELLDNASDEVLGHGFGNRIDITYNEASLTFSVQDNGRGIPTAFDPTHNQYLATMVLTEPRAGRNFGERGEIAGTNGIGASAVSITSEWFEVDIHREGKRFQQKFTEGNIVTPGLQIFDPKITAFKSDKTGTLVRYHPSKEVYRHRELPESFVRSRITEFAISNPYIKVYYNDELIRVKPRPEVSLFGSRQIIPIEIKEENFRSRFWIVPNFVESGDHVHTLVNNIPAFNGGVHIDTFKRLFYGNLLVALERESRKRNLQPNRSDVTEGVLLYNITNMKAPNFDSQSKSRLINEEVGSVLKKHLEDPEFYKDLIRKNRDWIDEIFERCAERTKKKDAVELARLARKVQKIKVADLMDATGKRRQDCILLLAEGNSAVAGMAAVRNPDIHGGLALRGKVMNVNGEHARKILDNSTLTDVMNTIGLVMGQKVDRSDLRYGKIFLAHDADADGLNIGALLINFFYSYWPELFDKDLPAIIHVFRTPYIIAEKGKQRKYWYSHNYSDFKAEEYSGWAVTRAKGLGTLTEEDWKYSLEYPDVFPIVDDGKMEEALDLIFNAKRTDERKEWIGL